MADTVFALDMPCREWAGSRNHFGYGTLGKGGRWWLAHRLTWHETYGPIPDGMCVLHRCDNPPCHEPTHLFLGTRADNIRDCIAKGRRRYLRGESHGRAKLTMAKVLEARERKASGWSWAKLERHYGVSHRAMWLAVRGRTWQTT